MAPGKRASLPGTTAGSSSRPPKKQKSTSSFSENTMDHSMKQLEAIIRDQSRKIEELQTEVNELKEKCNILQTPTDTNQTRNEQVDQGRYELKILGTIKNRVYTDSSVKGENGELLKVEICYNGEKITSGAFASAKFEVVVVEGDFCASEQGWSAETFKKCLVKAREEVGSILKGRYIFELKKGETLLDGLSFKDNSSWYKKKWRLGIRLLESKGVRVLEAISSNCIRVLDRHGKASEKPRPPLLTDGIECLEKVGKKRASDLKENKIRTIKGFLRLSNRKQSRLLKILRIKADSDASWQAMIKHAKECYVGPKLYSYRKNSSLLFFNSVYEVVGAQFEESYRPFDKLEYSEKVLVNKWKKGFYKNIKEIRNLLPDFEMVNNEPLPIEHDLTCIPNDNGAQQNDETSSQVREEENSSVALNSAMEDSVDEPCHNVSFPEEQEGPNTSHVPIHCMLLSRGCEADLPTQGTIDAEQPTQEDSLSNQNNIVNPRSILKKMRIVVKFVIYLRSRDLFCYMLALDPLEGGNLDDLS